MIFTILVTLRLKEFDKFSDHENIHSVNPLYLIVRSATGYFKEKNSEKYLILDSTEKYEEVFFGIKSEIERINRRKEMFHEKDHGRIGVNTDDNVPLNKKIKFSNLNDNY